MKHFLITRFHYGKDYPNLNQRLQLFRQYTRPSVEAQTDQNFEWLILGEPPINIPGARKFGDQLPAPLPTTMKEAYLDYIREVSKDEDYVLMTRLDNDDMLMPTFMKEIHNQVHEPGLLYEFLGYRLDLRNGRFYKDKIHTKDITSPFTTLVSTPRNLKTVYYCNHSKMGNIFGYTLIKKRGWVQIIHDTNWLLNRCSPRTTAGKGTKTVLHPFVKRLMESCHPPA